MGSKAVNNSIQSSPEVHFSGFHLEKTDASAATVESHNKSTTKNIKQPFVIGEASILSHHKNILLTAMIT